MKTIGIVGLGYVGLPLALEFGKRYPVIGYDINEKRIKELKSGIDHTFECSESDLNKAINLKYSNQLNDLKDCKIFIITVPTPIDNNNKPDLTFLVNACKSIGSLLKNNDLVIFESTVYPGTTEEICVPILELSSGLKFNKNFYCGYSPERINPGDKIHTLPNVVKITSGSSPAVADEVDRLYSSIISAGTHKTKSIRIAEAAKVIENTQRDVNIALMNELSIIFNKLQIDTHEVLEAAGTKWNFLPFQPGLVGGHCIGVDPYYLTYKAEQIGYSPEVILTGRRINDGMGKYVAIELKKIMASKNKQISDSKVLVLGLAFKENCPDVRNTKVIDVIRSLESFNMKVDVYDPWIDSVKVNDEYNLNCLSELPKKAKYRAIIIAVAHRDFIEMGSSIMVLGEPGVIIYDVKGVLPKDLVDGRL